MDTESLSRPLREINAGKATKLNREPSPDAKNKDKIQSGTERENLRSSNPRGFRDWELCSGSQGLEYIILKFFTQKI